MNFLKLGAAGLMAFGIAQATVKFPFPQNSDYGNASAATLTDKALASTQLQTAFDYYYTTFYRENGNYACIRADPGDNQCFSEGIGYGMLMMVYFSNATTSYQSAFDKLWALYKAAEDKYGLMNWKIGNANPTEVWGEYAATDAEVDVAAALIMAAYQFDDASYLTEAKTLLQNVRTYEFESNGLHKPGDNWNDKKNPSYISPAYYRLFAAVDTDGADFWNTTAMNANYALLEANSASHSTGLFDNWTDTNGVDLESRYGYDAARTPWRLGQAWYWFGDTRAQALLQKLGTWVNTQPATSVGGSISVSGSMGADHNNTFVATLMTSLSAGKEFQTNLDAYWNEAVATTGSEANQKYFQKSMEILNGLLVSGNMPDFTSGKVSISKVSKALSNAVAVQGKTLNLNVSKTGEVKLYDLTGHALLNSTVSAGSSTLSLAKVPSGVYFVQIRSEGKSELHKIRVE
ncbi:MAG: T9SS type A sorting domain-containing protein [Fibrobacter sp.]|nr:T9SS type A sorting domain-containing protein [Fibrobacter sp.]